jgi:hypothetical protein
MFSVSLKLNFISFDDIKNNFKIYLDDNGDPPTIELGEEGEVEDYIFEKSLDLFRGPTDGLLNTAKLSSIEKEKDTIYIVYNIFCYQPLQCKIGKFVNFDKNSIDLYRFASNEGL